MNKAAPRDTRENVRIPAVDLAARRSTPIIAPQATATDSRRSMWRSIENAVVEFGDEAAVWMEGVGEV